MVLGLGIHFVKMDRVMIHRQQAEEIVVALANRLARPVTIYVTILEIVEPSAE